MEIHSHATKFLMYMYVQLTLITVITLGHEWLGFCLLDLLIKHPIKIKI